MGSSSPPSDTNAKSLVVALRRRSGEGVSLPGQPCYLGFALSMVVGGVVPPPSVAAANTLVGEGANGAGVVC